MLMKLRTFASLYRELGLRWSAFRLAYAFRLRTGLIRLQMPRHKWSDRPLETWLKKDFRAAKSPQGERSSRHVVEARLPENIPWNPQNAIAEADRILNGELKYFAHEFVKTGFPPSWRKDYFTGHVTLSGASRHEGSLPQQSETLRSRASTSASPPLSAYKHWSQISDDADVDIKFIWEPNRFAFVYTLVRAYAASHDEKYAEAFWQSILDWAEHNPPNTGPNWMDGQEIALRLMAWTFGYSQFSNSPNTTPQRIEQFTLFVAAQAERIYKNIGYAISTRSNHTVSEAFGLWLVGLLFPELKDSEKYLSLGRKLLEQATATQILPDGSYSMYSLNYHRFILHIYLCMIGLSKLNQSPVSNLILQKVESSITYLSHLIDPQTGQMPVYGSNDGALVLPLNNCDFTDYRPLLQLGWYITKGERLFKPGPWDEDIFWLFGAESPSSSGAEVRDEGEPLAVKAVKNAKKIKNLRDLRDLIAALRSREQSFPHGGTYLLHNTNSKAVIRCTDFRARPSHADQLHVDLWMHGQNIACDAGTYLYSGESPWRNGLARTSAHNTVTVDGKDQMIMVSRFTWTNWSKGRVLQHTENLWQGEHDGYKPVSHKRSVMALEGDRWLVIDHLIGNEPHHYELHWLLCDGEYGMRKPASANGLWLNPSTSKLADSRVNIQIGLAEGKSNFSIVRADPNSTRGWRSRYYGHKEPAISVMLEASQPQAMFWSFFGFENDVIEVEGKVLKLNSTMIPLVQ